MKNTSEDLITVQESQLEEINVKLSDEQVAELLNPERKKKRVVVYSVGPLAFDLSLIDVLKKRIKVTVLLVGIPVGDVVLDESSLEQSIGPNVGIAKASVTLAVNWAEQQVTYTAKACVRNWRMKWKCADYSGVVKSW